MLSILLSLLKSPIRRSQSVDRYVYARACRDGDDWPKGRDGESFSNSNGKAFENQLFVGGIIEGNGGLLRVKQSLHLLPTK